MILNQEQLMQAVSLMLSRLPDCEHTIATVITAMEETIEEEYPQFDRKQFEDGVFVGLDRLKSNREEYAIHPLYHSWRPFNHEIS